MEASIARVAAADKHAWNEPLFVDAYARYPRVVKPCAVECFAAPATATCPSPMWRGVILTIQFATAVAMHTRNLLTSLTSSARHMQIVRKILPLTFTVNF